MCVKYLKPLPLAPAGDLIIRHEPDVQLPPAPPIILRQREAAQRQPPPLIMRERPPTAPAPVPTQVITLPGKVLPPPERQVIIERIPAPAPKPQDVIIERWLDYPAQKRRVTYEKPATNLRALPTPENLLINWEAKDETKTRQRVDFLGVESADPDEYERRFHSELVESDRLPNTFAREISAQVPHGEQLAANHTNSDFQLTGDVDALNLVDRTKVNMNDYLIPNWLYRH